MLYKYESMRKNTTVHLTTTSYGRYTSIQPLLKFTMKTNNEGKMECIRFREYIRFDPFFIVHLLEHSILAMLSRFIKHMDMTFKEKASMSILDFSRNSSHVILK